MSKYVDKPHGLTIGSDNWFFVVGDGDQDMRADYRAIVSIRGYRFDQIDTLNCQIWTPAMQILWLEKREPVEREFEGTTWTEHTRYYVLSRWCRDWLNRTVGEERKAWDVRSRNQDRRGPLFFKRRKDALAFCNEVDLRLKGITIGEF